MSRLPGSTSVSASAYSYWSTVVGTLQTPFACRRMYGTSGSPRDNERPYSSGTDWSVSWTDGRGSETQW
ncbi:hypothetical protein BRD18_00035 [Halobacteriales archaeon SW_7_71_33]|nr:MAG: hypothetical protein BRD18_00035 [Halobacteriales archaeon SW_7_71_33]